MGPDVCDRCEKCGSDLATHPDAHAVNPQQHDFRAVAVNVVTDLGTLSGTVTRCRFCGKTQAEIEARGEADDGGVRWTRKTSTR
jgi:hypothetical protein